MATATLQIGRLTKTKLAALSRKAERSGLTPEQYVKRLIEDDLEIDEEIRNTSLYELAAPWREAMKGKTEAEVDALVEAARDRHYARRSGSLKARKR